MNLLELNDTEFAEYVSKNDVPDNSLAEYSYKYNGKVKSLISLLDELLLEELASGEIGGRISHTIDFISKLHHIDYWNEKEDKGFRELVRYHDKDAFISRLHETIEGKKGKAVAIILIAALDRNLIQRLPKRGEFLKEFPQFDDNAWNGIQKYARAETKLIKGELHTKAKDIDFELEGTNDKSNG